MQTTKKQLQISIVLLVLIFVFLYLFTSVFGDARVNLTLTTNPDLKNGLVGHWMFDGSIANEIVDKSRTGNVAYFGTTTTATSTMTVPGVIGQATELDGVDDYIMVADDATLKDFTEVTMTAWVYPDTMSHSEGGSFPRIIAKENNTAGGSGFLLSGRSNNQVRYRSGASGYNFDSGSSNTLPLGEWTFVVITITSSEAIMYFNDSVATTTSGDHLPASGTNPLYIGGSPADVRNWDGKIDDARIYNRALSAAEVLRLYQLGATTKVNKTITTNPDLERGLIGHWTFDGSDLRDNVSDRSVTEGDGALQGQSSTTTVPGNIGQAIEFDGVDDEVIVPAGDGSTYDFGGSNFTIAVWIKSALTSTGYVVSADGITNERYDVQLQSDGDIEFVYSTGDVQTITASGSYNDGAWHHIVAIRDGARTGELYVDGALAASDTDNGGSWGGIEIISDLYFGGNAIGGDQFLGIIDDVRMYNRDLSSAEVKRLYELGATTRVNTTVATNPDVEDGLVGHWTFDGGDIDTASNTAEVLDRSGNEYNGDWQNHATTTVPGKVGQGIEFDGTNDYIDIPDTATLEPSQYTLTAWIKPNSHVNYARVMAHGDSVAGIMMAFGTGANNNKMRCLNYDGNFDVVIHPPDLNDTGRTWYHVACVKDSSNITIFINGESSESTASGDPSYAAGEYWRFGDDLSGASYYFDGVIDDLRIYNRALSTSTIQRLYQLGN